MIQLSPEVIKWSQNSIDYGSVRCNTEAVKLSDQKMTGYPKPLYVTSSVCGQWSKALSLPIPKLEVIVI